MCLRSFRRGTGSAQGWLEAPRRSPRLSCKLQPLWDAGDSIFSTRKMLGVAPTAAAGQLSSMEATKTSNSKIRRTPLPLRSPRAPAGTQFRVLQWNILADGLAQFGDFVKTPSDVLEWEYRAPLVLAEIAESGAELICLQELNHYEELLKQLEPLGYAGTFMAKSCSPAERYRCPPDGVAIFYKHQRFKVVAPAKGRTFVDDHGAAQSQGFLQVLLHDRVVGYDLLLVTTHLKAKEGAKEDDTRVRQAGQLLDSVCSTLRGTLNSGHSLASHDFDGPTSAVVRPLSASSSNGHSHHVAPEPCEAVDLGGNGGTRTCARCFGRAEVPVIITGDFNTTPTSQTCQTMLRHPLRFKSLWNEQPDHLAAALPAIAAATAAAAAAAGTDGSRGGSSSQPLADPAPVTLQGNGLSCSGPSTSPPSSPSLSAQDNAPASSISAPSTGYLNGHSLPTTTAAAASSTAAPSTSTAAATSPTTAPSTSNAAATPTPPPAASSSAAAAAPSPSTSTAEFSTWKFRSNGESKRTIDYIWFSGDGKLQPTARWKMLSEAEIGPDALPSRAYASDHVSVCAVFEWDLPLLEWAPGADDGGGVGGSGVAGASGSGW